MSRQKNYTKIKNILVGNFEKCVARALSHTHRKDFNCLLLLKKNTITRNPGVDRLVLMMKVVIHCKNTNGSVIREGLKKSDINHFGF